MKYAFIETHRGQHRVSTMCRVLEVSSSGYYAWRKRTPGQRELADRKLLLAIREVHRRSHARYGARRIQAELKAQGHRCSRKRVARLMAEHDLEARRRRRYRITTQSKHNKAVAPNVLNREFKAEAPNQKWVADITYIPTAEGWLYLAAVLDLHSRKVVGWAIEPYLRDDLVQQALNMAVGRRKLQGTLLHHSDRGSQYASHDYRALLAKHGIEISMSGKGNCFDNAPMESFFSTLKSELVHHTRFQSRAQARRELFEFIEVYYNRQRLHSALGYLSPHAFEERFYLT
jgi:transposase InsO family protein